MDIVAKVRSELKKNSDDITKRSALKFFKEEVKVYGTKTAVVSRIAKENYKTVKGSGKSEIFKFCEQFWESGYLEESFIACNWSYLVNNGYDNDDFILFERWVRDYISNWASCDTLCNHTIGTLVEKYPDRLNDLKRWATSDNRWVRRASAVSLIIPARKGMFLKDIFDISDILLKDPDDMVQKGYGWMLKVASQAHQKEVFDYVMKNRAAMPRTALRYAIEKMPSGLKVMAMERDKKNPPQ
jgi:3-methyladenine DNA glycosylase AlkD